MLLLGIFETGQGTRFIRAGTSELHDKISAMAARIRELEDALPCDHPLLVLSKLKIKETSDLAEIRDHTESEETAMAGPSASGSGSGYRASGGAGGGNRKEHFLESCSGSDTESENEEGEKTSAGTLQVCYDGASAFYGRSAGAETVLLSLSPSSSSLIVDPSFSHSLLTSPSKSATIALSELSARLPHYARAHALLRAYVCNSAWQAGATVGAQQAWGVFGVWYAPTVDQQPSSVAESTHTEGDSDVGEEPRTPHTLALLFILLALGAFALPPSPTPSSYPPSPQPSSLHSGDIEEAPRLFSLGCSALKLGGLTTSGGKAMGGPIPSVAGAQVLVLMSVYLAFSEGQGVIPLPHPSPAVNMDATRPGVKTKKGEDDQEHGLPWWYATGMGMEPMWGVLGLARSVASSVRIPSTLCYTGLLTGFSCRLVCVRTSLPLETMTTEG